MSTYFLIIRSKIGVAIDKMLSVGFNSVRGEKLGECRKDETRGLKLGN